METLKEWCEYHINRAKNPKFYKSCRNCKHFWGEEKHMRYTYPCLKCNEWDDMYPIDCKKWEGVG